jgi:hypothetical protein
LGRLPGLTIYGGLKMNEEKRDINKELTIQRKKEIFETDDDGNLIVGHMGEMPKKVLTTSSKAVQREPLKPEPHKLESLTTNEMSGGKFKAQTDLQFIIKNIDMVKDREIKNLRKQIENRIAELPKFIYLKCDNPACQWKGKSYYNRNKKQAGQPCMWCNWQRIKTGGFLHEMSKAEAVEFDRQEAERDRLISERREKVEFFHDNKKREERGLDPLEFQQWQDLKKKIREGKVKPGTYIY